MKTPGQMPGPWINSAYAAISNQPEKTDPDNGSGPVVSFVMNHPAAAPRPKERRQSQLSGRWL